MTSETLQAPQPRLWAVAFCVGMIGTGLLARYFQFGTIVSMVVMLPPMLLLIPLVRSTERAQAQDGALSRAVRRYNRRSMIWSFAYALLLFAAIGGRKALVSHGMADSPVLWVLAVLPALPLLYLLWAMGRYLAEEQDEYLRMRAVNSALFATGLLLAIATIWGFLGTFRLVPQAPGWAAVPIWAIGMGLANVYNRRKDQ
ncbi:hypothetical protein WSK_1466 [Novosphingobium sp. Rr 2-17]|uniref:hypothetical protein n=1 Tax=Novosphingobium sp. Rr 2-17 TaxID=555793 RepID=UPI0002698EBA|nr:hypothetical protein [Novosphingobium sp. Rr 2-17]EIZ79928.1 hypothetical protein WSK_1466 [Novosphingobium sp. Rr 2-17]